MAISLTDHQCNLLRANMRVVNENTFADILEEISYDSTPLDADGRLSINDVFSPLFFDWEEVYFNANDDDYSKISVDYQNEPGVVFTTRKHLQIALYTQKEKRRIEKHLRLFFETLPEYPGIRYEPRATTEVAQGNDRSGASDNIDCTLFMRPASLSTPTQITPSGKLPVWTGHRISSIDYAGV